MLHEMVNQIAPMAVLLNATKTSDTNCTPIDRQLFTGSVLAGSSLLPGGGFNGFIFLVEVGDAGDTWDASNYLQLKIEESDDNSSYTQVTSTTGLVVDSSNLSTLLVSNTIKLVSGTTDDKQVYAIGYIGDARYFRLVLDFTGTHSSGTKISVTCLKCLPNRAPVNNAGN